MKSPLEFDAAVVKEFGITDTLEPEYKLGYARTQLEEITKALWRERVELLIAQMQVDSASDESVKAVHQAKVNEKRMLIVQFVRSVTLLTVLVDELQKSLA